MDTTDHILVEQGELLSRCSNFYMPHVFKVRAVRGDPVRIMYQESVTDSLGYQKVKQFQWQVQPFSHNAGSWQTGRRTDRETDTSQQASQYCTHAPYAYHHPRLPYKLYCVGVTGTFVTTYFCSQERKYHRWNFRSLVLSLPGTFAPECER